MIDRRIIRVGIEIEGDIRVYEDLAIRAIGTKHDNALMNEAEITVYNMTREARQYLLTAARPYDYRRVPKRIYLDAGRESYGVGRIFDGMIIEARPTQPPDVGVVMRCFTGHFYRTDIVSKTYGESVNLSEVANGFAESIGVPVDFQATDKRISNYSFIGPALEEIDKMNLAADVNAYLDDDVLVVKDAGAPLNNQYRIISEATGMVGTPELTALGCAFRVMLDPSIKVGQGVTLLSDRYPVVNGNYVIFKLSYDIANRDEPFYMFAETSRYPRYSTQ